MLEFDLQVGDEAMELIIFCDFDGTVAPFNVAEHQLTRFLPDIYPTIAAAWSAGYINSTTLYRLAWEMLNSRGITVEELRQDALDGYKLDPAFAPFARECRQRGWELRILSDGTAWYILPLLERAGLGWVSVHCNSIIHLSNKEWILGFPWLWRAGDQCGVCKRDVLRWSRIAGFRHTVYIGDGLGDRCPVLEADCVFAKGTLAHFCEQENIAYEPFESFTDVHASIDRIQAVIDEPSSRNEFMPGEKCPHCLNMNAIYENRDVREDTIVALWRRHEANR
jgi:2-hydroxy-3-keto-5-methylthiopentenyl-1-phosphate phosphatase